MNCSKCGKALAAGAKACAACGTEASSSYSYDLLPEEPAQKKKEAEAPPFALPEGAALPPPVVLGGGTDMGTGHQAPAKPKRSPTSVAGLNSGGGLTLRQITIGAFGVLALVLLFFSMCGGSSFKLKSGQPKSEGSATIFATMPRLVPVEIIGSASYTYTVQAVDGDVSIGVVNRMSKERPTPEMLKSWNLTPVAKGESHTLTGKMTSGLWSFVAVTESKKSVRIKVSYQIK